MTMQPGLPAGGPAELKSARPDEVDPRTPVFFLSYARAVRGVAPNARFFNFFEELSENVAQLVARPVGAEPGFMDRSIASGAHWTPELLKAIGTCQVFVALLSPPYVSSMWCGQEWWAFKQREVVKRSGEPDYQTAIIPVIWAPLADEDTPAAVHAVQRFSPDGVPDIDTVSRYQGEGVLGLLQMGLTERCGAVNWQLARRIAAVHRSHWVRPRTFHESELRDIFQEGRC
jgi:hypothetical protein